MSEQTKLQQFAEKIAKLRHAEEMTPEDFDLTSSDILDWLIKEARELTGVQAPEEAEA